MESFHPELQQLRSEGRVARHSRLVQFAPFILDGLLRMGGCLQAADLKFDEKHPIMLHAQHPFTRMLLNYEHIRLGHPGTNLLTAVVHQRYFVICGTSLYRRILRECVKCARYAACASEQIMGNLPIDRVTTNNRAFDIVGIDYAGPFDLKVIGALRRTDHNGYIAVFVCFASKALHLEAVSDLSTEKFRAALDRFAGCRGYLSKIYSDNGTNFVGADNELARLHEVLQSEAFRASIQDYAANHKIEWNFIPPSGPHFGGLWESGVKSVKKLLVKAIDRKRFSFEEFLTILVRIEAYLNSRPLVALTDGPNDYAALTPGHLAIGKNLRALLSEPVPDPESDRLSQWKAMNACVHFFWKRWSVEYLNSLQQRRKWYYERNEPKIGDIILLKSPQLPPMQWSIARIVDVHPGPDGRVRVVTVQVGQADGGKGKRKTLVDDQRIVLAKHGIQEIIYLPVQADDQADDSIEL